MPGKSHVRRSLVGCSPWVAKSWTRLSDFTFTFHFHALEKEVATHSSVLAWRISGTGQPGGLPSMGLHRVGHDWSDLAAAATTLIWAPLCLWHWARYVISAQHFFPSPSIPRTWTFDRYQHSASCQKCNYSGDIVPTPTSLQSRREDRQVYSDLRHGSWSGHSMTCLGLNMEWKFGDYVFKGQMSLLLSLPDL